MVEANDKPTDTKKARAAALARVTKAKNELRQELEKPDADPRAVEASLAALTNLFELYRLAHLDVQNDEAVVDDDHRHADVEDGFHGFQTRVQTWIRVKAPPPQQERQDVPTKKAPSVASKTSSSSATSSIRAAHAREKAELAALLTQQKNQRALAELKAKEEELNLQMKIDACRARDAVFAEYEVRSEANLNVDAKVFVPKCQSIGYQVNEMLNVQPNPLPDEHVDEAMMKALYDVVKSERSPNAVCPSASYAMDACNDSPCKPPYGAHRNSSKLSDASRDVLDLGDAIVTAMSMPQPQLRVFRGDVLEYQSFMDSFSFRVGRRPLSDFEKLQFLKEYVEGEPKVLVEGCTRMQDGYTQALTLLDEAYGNEFGLAHAYMQKLSAWPAIKANDAAEN
jgi:hypothetical protein